MIRTIDAVLKNSWVDLLLRWFLGCVFLYASIHKITAPAEFAKIIYGYGLVPLNLINLIAIFLPFIEFVTGAALLMGVWPRSATIIINTMLLIFIVAISINLIRGHEFDCGCFSLGKNKHSLSAVQLLVRDIFWFVCGLLVFSYRGKRKLCIIE